MSMKRVPVVVVMMILAIALAGLVPAGAQSQGEIDDIERQINEIESLIQNQEGRRSSAENQLAEAQGRLQILHDELAALKAEIDAVEASIAAKEQKLADTELLLDRLSRDLANTRLEVRDSRTLVRDRAIELYMDRSLNVGGVIATVQDVSQLGVSLEYAGQVVASSEELLNALEVLQRQEQQQQAKIEEEKLLIEQLIAELEVERAGLAEQKVALDAKAEEVHAEVDAAAALVAEINASIAAYESEIGDLEAESARIAEEIRRRSSSGGGGGNVGGGGGGALAWPVSGPITSGFGWRTHPITGTSRFHAGIDIGVGHGTPIGAAGSGVVIISGWQGGYGNAVVIDHGGGLSTLYAHQSSLAVSTGQSVSTGQLVGYIGSTGFSTGPHLHFETRVGGSPVNPLQYLGG